MRLLVALLIVVAAAVHSVWVSDRPAVLAADDVRTFRVATYNIHKGADSEGRYDLERTIDTIASLDADLVGVQEAMRNDPRLDCADQPARIADGLRRRTGRRWTYVYAKSWILDDRTCMERGRGGDVMTEGVAVFTPDRLLVSDELRLPESRVALRVRVASMPDVPVVVTHLAASRRNRAHRVAQIDALLNWNAADLPGIVIGDLNARPESSELEPLFARYKDGWVDAWERGLHTGVASGGTRPFGTSRIDFVLYAPSAPLVVTAAEVVDTAEDPEEAEVSDHRPVVITFRRAPVTF